MRRPDIGAAFVEEKGGKGFDMPVGSAAYHGAAPALLRHHSARGEEPEMMGERRGRQAGALLNLCDAKPLVAGADEQAKHHEPRFGPARGESLRGLLDGEREKRTGTVFMFHITSFMVILFECQLQPLRQLADGAARFARQGTCLRRLPPLVSAVSFLPFIVRLLGAGRPVDRDTRSSSRVWPFRFRENPCSNGGGAYPWIRVMKASKRGTVNAA